MKQLLRLGQVASSHPETVEATMRLRLIAWALQEQEAQQIRGQLALAATEDPEPAGAAQWPAEAQEPEAPTEDPRGEKLAGTAPYAGPISGWLVVSLCLDLLTQQVRGYWSAARLQACLPRLRRFCRGSPRRRVHQETQVRAWLSQPPFEAG